MNTSKLIFRGLLSLVVISAIVLGAFFWLPAKIHYHVIERYHFSGTGADAQVHLGVMLPKNGPYQAVENLNISWDGDWEVDDFGFVEAARLSGVKREDRELIAAIEYDVKLSQGNVSWDAPIEEFQRLPQAGIESDCDCIQKQAADLCEGASEQDAYEIYAFTADYLTYSEEYQDCTSISAMQAYEIGSCVCAGYARLMTALCRASGIPAQMVLGLVYPDPMFRSSITSFPENPEEAHAWVEYYAGGRWRMADPTWGGKQLKWLHFNRADGRHLVYGELEQVLAVDKSLEHWALSEAGYLLGDDRCFRYIATSDERGVSFSSQTSIQRTWDGRWLNTVLVWGVMMFVLRKFRGKIIGKS